MGKRPSFQTYPGDWLRDSISGCSLAAQGLWLRMMFIAHDSERYGYLQQNGKPIPHDSIARRSGAHSVEQYLALLQELDDAGVPSRTPDGVIYSRRMVRDERERELTAQRVSKHRSNGKCNARVTPKYEEEVEEEKGFDLVVQDQDLKTKPSKKTSCRVPSTYVVSDEMRAFAARNKLPDPDLHIAEFIDYWTAQPGQRGVKSDWDATFRNWLRRAQNFKGNGNGKLSFEQRAQEEREIARQYAARTSG